MVKEAQNYVTRFQEFICFLLPQTYMLRGDVKN